MIPNCFKVLLIEDNAVDARVIQAYLDKGDDVTFDVQHCDRLLTGLKCLAAGGIDVVLLDLTLPDSQGFETFAQAYAQEQDVPIVVLTVSDDYALAIQAVQAGAQDYLIKTHFNYDLLVRSLHYAMERHRMVSVLRTLALVDELTGLYNRRGFDALAEQNLKLAKRTGRQVLVGVADLDGLKTINDTFGHDEGDKALIETAKILKETFRETDIIARIGGDEFVVIALEASGDAVKNLTVRLQENVQQHNSKRDLSNRLSISMGLVCYDSESSSSVDDLVAQADRLMYEQKGRKKTLTSSG